MMLSSASGISGLRVRAESGVLLKIASKMTAEVGPLKACAAGGHFIKDSAKGKQIGAGIERIATGLLGGHIGDVPMEVPGVVSVACGRGAFFRVERRVPVSGETTSAGELGEAEIENLGLARLGDKDVGGLDIAMGDAASVGVIERIGDLQGDVQKAVGCAGLFRKSNV